MKESKRYSPCNGACCPKRDECIHYATYKEYKAAGKYVVKYVGNGKPSACYAHDFRLFVRIQDNPT